MDLNFGGELEKGMAEAWRARKPPGLRLRPTEEVRDGFGFFVGVGYWACCGCCKAVARL